MNRLLLRVTRRLVALHLAMACFATPGAEPAMAPDTAATTSGFSLDGLWFESDNYPASSVLRFSPFGKGFVARYVKVSPPQQQLGFKVGETVIRGKLVGSKFVGEVLLKPTNDSPLCKGVTVGWLPITLSFAESGKLEGRWMQEWVDGSPSCRVIETSWQPYRLERLPSK